MRERTHQVVSLCDLTGNMVRPWAEAGYHCLCIDVQHSIRADRVEQVGLGSITFQWADVRGLEPIDAAMMFAFPPCTDLAVSGARDFKKKGLRRYIDALEIVESCRLLCAYSGGAWMLENPVGRLSTAWRKPDHTFDPCELWRRVHKKDVSVGRRWVHHAGEESCRADARLSDAPDGTLGRSRQPAERYADGLRACGVPGESPSGAARCRMRRHDSAARGGQNDPSNLLLSCEACNESKGARSG